LAFYHYDLSNREYRRRELKYDKQITFAPHTHVLTNVNVWSPDSKRIVYDVRSDPSGKEFDGDRIETVDVDTGEVKILNTSKNGAKCGVATYHPTLNRVVFILGPEYPTPDFTYGFARRQGVMVDEATPGVAVNLDARDLSPPFTPGALRGGSHVHVFSPDGQLVSFTYDDHVLGEASQRNVGVSEMGQRVTVPETHPRNHAGEAFSVLVTRTVADPKPGSDEIKKAYEEGWVVRDGKKSLAFLGDTVDEEGRTVPEIFVADLPVDLTQAGDEPLQGTATTPPGPPRGVTQRRLTRTPYQIRDKVPRHWLRASPDGKWITFLRPDADGVSQIWVISPAGGEARRVTNERFGVISSFTWSPDGRRVTYGDDDGLWVTDVDTKVKKICVSEPRGMRPEAVVFSPDGKRIAFTRMVDGFAQIFVGNTPE